MSTPSSPPRIAFLGLGIMGSGMAHRLLNAGFPLTVFNRDGAKAAPFAAGGARVASSAREAAQGAELIISMLADDGASRSVWLGEEGALAGAARGAVAIDSSTVTVEWIKKLSVATARHGCDLLDAPVTGSRLQAAAGELNFLVGGSAAVLERARPALTAMGKSVTHLGPTGSGALIKLINNFVCGVQVASLAEALGMIEQAGLDRANALAVLTNGAPGSPLVKTVSARMIAADYTPNFRLRLLAKDLGYAIQQAREQALDLATAAAALAVLQKSIAAGHGDQDMAATVEQFRQR